MDVRIDPSVHLFLTEHEEIKKNNVFRGCTHELRDFQEEEEVVRYLGKITLVKSLKGVRLQQKCDKNLVSRHEKAQRTIKS